MPRTIRHWVSRVKKALLGRTLKGRKLERPVRDEQGRPLFESGRRIDDEVLEKAREKGRLEELTVAAEPATSDTELEDLLRWSKQRQNDSAQEER